MRMMMTVDLDTETSNPMVQSGKIGELIGQILGQLKPECAYFLPGNGGRRVVMVVDVPDATYIATTVEPFWQELNAEVDLVPCMTVDDLQAGLARMH